MGGGIWQCDKENLRFSASNCQTKQVIYFTSSVVSIESKPENLMYQIFHEIWTPICQVDTIVGTNSKIIRKNRKKSNKFRLQLTITNLVADVKDMIKIEQNLMARNPTSLHLIGSQ